MKKVIKFNIGDKVFAKVKGYPAWPAIIEEDHKVKYNVKFYGTGETAVVKPNDLFYYIKYKKSLQKPLKRKDYNDAVEDIEKAIREAGTDGDVDTDTLDLDSSVSKDASDSTETKTKKRKRSVNSAKANSQAKKKASAAAAAAVASADTSQESDAMDATIEDEELSEVDDTNESVSSKKSSKNSKAKDNNVSVEEIKDEDLKDIKILTVDFLTVMVSYAEHTRKKQSEYEKMPVQDRPNKKQVVMAKINSDEYFGMKFYQDTPPAFKNEFERAIFDETEANRLLALKKDLEDGTLKPSDVPESLEENFVLSNKRMQHYVEMDLIDRKKAKLNWLTKEANLIEHDAKIKACLGLDKADPKAALEHLSAMAKMEIDPLMLKKHPHVVDMVKRLRRYIGNTKEWNMSNDERDKFELEAGSVRTKAEVVFTNFASLFQVKDPLLFWNVFSTEVDKFKEQVKDIQESHIFALSAEPYSRQAFFDRIDDEEELQSIVAKLEKSSKIQKENSNQVTESDNEQNKEP